MNSISEFFTKKNNTEYFKRISPDALQKYYPNLDGLRGIAIVLVLVEHWWSGKGMLDYIHFGALGVGLFFVLSGFLIGRILLIERLRIEEDRSISVFRILKNFYIRRSLRIFPVYYLTLVLILMAGFPSVEEIEDFFPWAAFYLVNIKIFLTQHHIWPCGHFWTLSIEEQFYLITPVLFFIIPFRHILPVIICFILAGVFSRIVLYADYKEYGSFFTTSAFDYFGFGILLAYMHLANIKRMQSTGILLLLFACYLYLSGSFMHFSGKSFLFVVLPILPIAFFILVEKVLNASEQHVILSNKYIRYIGKISYGIYVYHPFMPFVRSWFFTSTNMAMDICIDAVLTLIIASLSYTYMETPVNKLKHAYRYV